MGSINSDKPNAAKDPDYIKQSILAPQIEWASTLVVYVTPDAKDSEWVNCEIDRHLLGPHQALVVEVVSISRGAA